MTYLYKNRGFSEILEQIRALYANKDGHSYIRVVSESYVQKKTFR